MAQTDLDIVNQSLGIAGAAPLAALDASTPLGAFAVQQWPRRKAFLLGFYRWVFAARVAQLEQLAVTPPECPFDFAYERPADVIGAIHAFRNDPRLQAALAIEPVQLADYIAAPTTPLWAEYTADVDTATFPPWFNELAAKSFGADCARRTLKETLANTLMVECFGPPEAMGQGGLMLAAMQMDSRNAQQRSLEYADGGALVAARMGVGVGLGQVGGVAGWPNNGFPFVVEVTGS
jgi:hypothetical protein